MAGQRIAQAIRTAGDFFFERIAQAARKASQSVQTADKRLSISKTASRKERFRVRGYI